MRDAQTHTSAWTRWERIACILIPAMLSAALGAPWLFGERWMADTPYYQGIAMFTAREGGAAWWTLQEGPVPYFNKPPLAFWLHALSVKVFGEVDWAYRLPEYALYILTSVLVGQLARRLHGARIGLCAGVAMALTHDWTYRVSNFRLEFLLSALLVGAMICYARGFGVSGGNEDPSPPVNGTGVGRQSPAEARGTDWRWIIGAGVCIGLALLVKPLIALGMIPLVGAWLTLIGRMDRRTAEMLGMSALAAAVVAAPWHVGMMAQHGRAFTDAYFVNQAYKRATGQMFDPEPWWWYFQFIAGGDRAGGVPAWRMWPIYGLALGATALIIARGFPAHRRAGDVLALLYTFGWLASMCAFSDKRNYYLLVIHPGTAWLAGRLVGAIVPTLLSMFGWFLAMCVLDKWDPSLLVTHPGTARLVRRLREVVVLAWMRCDSIAGVIVATVLLIRAAIIAPEYRRIVLPPERAALMDFVREHRREPIYNGGLVYQEPALIYICTNVWPKYLREKEAVPPELIPPGAIALYREDQLTHARFPARMDPADGVLFRATGAKPAPNLPPRTYIGVRRRDAAADQRP